MTRKEIQQMSFEAALEALEKTVNRMEQETLSLADSMNAYETGRLLSEHCGKLLKAAQGRVVALSKQGEEWVETPITEED